MKQNFDEELKDKVSYQGRMVDKDTFRVFVYNKEGAKQLANSWDAYEHMIASGVWFAVKSIPEPEVVEKKKP